MKKATMLALLLALLPAALAGQVRAQRAGAGMGARGDMARALIERRRQLGLTDDQVNRLEELSKNFDASRQSMRDQLQKLRESRGQGSLSDDQREQLRSLRSRDAGVGAQSASGRQLDAYRPAAAAAGHTRPCRRAAAPDRCCRGPCADAEAWPARSGHGRARDAGGPAGPGRPAPRRATAEHDAHGAGLTTRAARGCSHAARPFRAGPASRGGARKNGAARGRRTAGCHAWPVPCDPSPGTRLGCPTQAATGPRDPLRHKRPPPGDRRDRHYSR